MNTIISQYLAHLNQLDGYYHFTAEEGRKFVKIVQTYNGHGGCRSVHSFVDKKTGELYKAAGWNAPAKGVRFNLSDPVDFQKVLTVSDVYGSYLYKR